MTNYRVRVITATLALVAAFLGGATPALAVSLPSVQTECGDTSDFRVVPLADLPAEATDTYDLIQVGGPYPYRQDGTTFQNRERLLPDCDLGYYAEYTVETPGSPTRGARRIVTGDGGEYFYTADHYASFVLIDVT
ncbi:ribonuclease domain-containing protein [Saccharomonospora sp. NPDC046836]|uniref:ribonuclease domain-containing protein n=1 Tax=Saccharomonospora sp. NPDC046836 TaxID=3156921 RepID=UPI0033EDF9A3